MKPPSHGTNPVDPKAPRLAEASGTALSVVIPVFNEAESLAQLHGEVRAALESLGRPWELIFVNDGSTDGSAAVLAGLAEHDERVVVVQLRRNFGQTAALTAGIDHCRGDVIVPLDADLQNDPADIPRLTEKLEEGYDVVSGWRIRRQDSWLTRVLPSRAANWLISVISGVRLNDYGCTLKAYRREVIDGVRLYGEMHRLIPVFAAMQGGRIAELQVNHRPRLHGQSKYGMARVFKVPLDLLLVKFLASYSHRPIHLFGGVGIACLLFSLVPICLALYFKFTTSVEWQKDFVETPLPVVAAVLILVGILALLQGLLAEMLMRTYFESQDKRTYLVRSVVRRDETTPGELE